VKFVAVRIIEKLGMSRIGLG